jgi:hypothetical protein
MHTFRPWLSSVMVVGSVVLSGCAVHRMSEPAPQGSKSIPVSYRGDDLSAWSDMPIGVYRVPNSQIVISGHQKTGNAPLILFGLIGAASANAIDRGVGKAAVKTSEQILHLTLTTEAQEELDRLLATDKYAARFTTKTTLGEPELDISGSIVLTFIDENSVAPFVVLKASLIQRDRSKEVKEITTLWSTRYICEIGAPRPLTGEGSWATDNGSALRSTVSAELKRALDYMLADIVAPVARSDANRILVSGYYPFIKGKFEIVAYSLGEDDDSVIFSPQIADASVVAGVAIFDKSQVSFRAATKDDKPFKRVTDTHP